MKLLMIVCALAILPLMPTKALAYTCSLTENCDTPGHHGDDPDWRLKYDRQHHYYERHLNPNWGNRPATCFAKDRAGRTFQARSQWGAIGACQDRSSRPRTCRPVGCR